MRGKLFAGLLVLALFLQGCELPSVGPEDVLSSAIGLLTGCARALLVDDPPNFGDCLEYTVVAVTEIFLADGNSPAEAEVKTDQTLLAAVPRTIDRIETLGSVELQSAFVETLGFGNAEAGRDEQIRAFDQLLGLPPR